MLAFMSLLVQSDELKKNGDRIINQVNSANDAKKIATEIVDNLTHSDTLKALQSSQRELYEKLISMIGKVDEKLDVLAAGISNLKSQERDSIAARSTEKKALKKA